MILCTCAEYLPRFTWWLRWEDETKSNLENFEIKYKIIIQKKIVDANYAMPKINRIIVRPTQYPASNRFCCIMACRIDTQMVHESGRVYSHSILSKIIADNQRIAW